MQITASIQEGIVIATLAGRMDAMTTVEFDHWFSEQRAAGMTRFVLDLQQLQYISSAGLRSLLSAAKQLKAAAGEMLICGLSGTVEEVFRISGFLTIFKVLATPEEALTALR